MLPFEPESLKLLKKRYPAAIEKIWYVTDPMPDRPGMHREHLFDFESGLRLLISKDSLVFGKIDIHVSASWERNPPRSLAEMQTSVEVAYRLLAGKDKQLHFIGFSAKAIPHWVVIK